LRLIGIAALINATDQRIRSPISVIIIAVQIYFQWSSALNSSPQLSGAMLSDRSAVSQRRGDLASARCGVK
jgi:hypothetical protein